MMKTFMTRAAALALVTTFLSNPVVAKPVGPVQMDRYDQCLEERCQVYINMGDWARYEFCRQDCERRFPPQ